MYMYKKYKYIAHFSKISLS